MDGVDSLSGWATLILMLPFVGLLGLSLFGLGGSLAAPRRRFRNRRRFCELMEDGQLRLLDPDAQGADVVENERYSGSAYVPARSLDAGSRGASGRPRQGEHPAPLVGGASDGTHCGLTPLSITLQRYLHTLESRAGAPLPQCGRIPKNLLT